jgi:hypothetical protein
MLFLIRGVGLGFFVGFGDRGCHILGVDWYCEVLSLTINKFVYLVCDCSLLRNSKKRLSVKAFRETSLTLLGSFLLKCSRLGIT